MKKWAKVGTELTADSLHFGVHEFLHFLFIKSISLSFWLKFMFISDFGGQLYSAIQYLWPWLTRELYNGEKDSGKSIYLAWNPAANFVVVFQLLSHVQLFVTPRTAAHEASLSFTSSRSFLKFMSIEFMIPSNHLILCHPLFFLPGVFPNIKVFSNESVPRIKWPNYWSFNFSISPSNEYSALISNLGLRYEKIYIAKLKNSHRHEKRKYKFQMENYVKII